MAFVMVGRQVSGTTWRGGIAGKLVMFQTQRVNLINNCSAQLGCDGHEKLHNSTFRHRVQGAIFL